jgi:hypothetical protein
VPPLLPESEAAPLGEPLMAPALRDALVPEFIELELWLLGVVLLLDPMEPDPIELPLDVELPELPMPEDMPPAQAASSAAAAQAAASAGTRTKMEEAMDDS